MAGLVLLLFASIPVTAHADVGLLLEQSIGTWGRISGIGHAAIYLSRICAESPTVLRRCKPGEAGVVISRYDHADRYDWTAIPLIPYLYAVEHPWEIPESVDASTVTKLRDRYRRAHLESVAPDAAHGKMPRGHWTELVGSAYERTTYVFEIETSSAQDNRLIQQLNAQPNRDAFNLLFRNCANFAQSVLNFYYPDSIHRSFTADFGLATPKQVAKSLVSYAEHHENLQFSTFVIPQVPGKIHRSGNVYGVVEALLKKKQYLIPLTIWHPLVMAALAGTYLARGRFNPAHDSIALTRHTEVQALVQNSISPREEPKQLTDLEVVHALASPDRDKPCPGNDCRQNNAGTAEYTSLR